MRTLLLLVFCTIAFVGCSQDYRSYPYKDIDGIKPRKVTLEPLPEQGATHTIWIHTKGKLDGKAVISMIRTEGTEIVTVKTREISGDVDFEWSNEWYSAQCEIEYRPITVTSGELRIDYRFGDIKKQ